MPVLVSVTVLNAVLPVSGAVEVCATQNGSTTPPRGGPGAVVLARCTGGAGAGGGVMDGMNLGGELGPPTGQAAYLLKLWCPRQDSNLRHTV